MITHQSNEQEEDEERSSHDGLTIHISVANRGHCHN